MAITFVAEGAVANVASGNVTPGAPAGTQAGDLLIACIAYRSNAAFTNPTGGEWTTIATQQSSGNTSTTASTAIASGHMAYCIRGASDPNFTFTRTGGDVARAMVFAFRGVDPTTPLDNANVVTEASNTSTPTVTGWTPSRANNLYVQFCAGADNVLSSAWQANGGSGWSSWTEQEDSNTTTGADTNLGVAWATSSAVDTITSFQVTKAASSRHVLFAAGFNVQNAWETGPLAFDAASGVAVAATAAEATFNQGGVDYLLRDRFTSDLDPLVDANASEGSGIGYRDVTGTGMYAASGRLRGGGASTNLCYRKSSGGSGWQRKGGRTLTAIVSPWDGDLDDLYFHLAETAGGIDGYGFRIVGGSSIYAYEPDGTTTLLLQEADNPIKAVRYQLGITLNEGEGAVYWITAMQDYVVAGTEWDLPAAPDARILWVSQIGTANEYFPTIRNDGAVSESALWEDVRLLDISGWAGIDGMAIVADRFDRADTTNDNASWTVDGGGTFGIASNKAYLVSGGGGQNQASKDAGTDDNVILAVKQTTGSSSVGNSGVIMNRVSGTREINLAPYNDSTIRMDSINGGFSTLATGGPYLSTGQTLRWVVMRQGNTYRYWVNGASSQDIVNPTTDSYQDSPGTYYGISTYSGPDAGVTWDSIAVYPLLLTLPTALQSTALDTPTVGSNLETKAFTDTNGTALTTHDAEWSVGAGTWTIQSNRASVAGSGDLYAYLSAGQADYQVTVDVIAGTLGDLRAGVILRRADANNMMRVRLFVDTAQADNDEIEIETVIGGSATVVQKCYLNDYFASAGTYELKCQVSGDVLYVYLDGVLHLVYYIPSSLLTGQGVGLYREGTVDDGATFDDFIVDAIGSTPAETGPLLLTAASGIASVASTEAFGQATASAAGGIATSATTEAFTGALAAGAAGAISSVASAEAFGQAAATAAGDIATSATADAFAGQIATGAATAISSSASSEAFTGSLAVTATGDIAASATADAPAETGPLALAGTSAISSSATTEAFGQVAASAAGDIAASAIGEALAGALALGVAGGVSVAASTDAFTGGLAIAAAGDIASAASTDAFTGGVSLSATGNVEALASATTAGETGPLALSAASGVGVSASSEAFAQAAASAIGDIASEATADAFTGGLGLNAAGGVGVVAAATTDYETGPLLLSATGGVGVSATSEAFTGGLAAAAAGSVAVTAAGAAFAGGLTLAATSAVAILATTAQLPITAGLSIARVAGVSMTIALAPTASIEDDEAASAALGFEP